MKQQAREVYGFGARFRTTARFPSARVVLVLVIAGMLAGSMVGCANHTPRQIVDTKGVDINKYFQDNAECKRYADQVDTGGSTVNGAVGGAILGALIGAAIGGSDGAAYGAKVFGVAGAAEGAGSAVRDKNVVMARCMQGRGYKVLL